MAASWAHEEFETIDLGDKRLDERLKVLAETLSDSTYSAPRTEGRARAGRQLASARRLQVDEGAQATMGMAEGSRLGAGPLPSHDPMASFMKPRMLRPWRLQLSSAV